MIVATPGRLWDLVQEGHGHLTDMSDVKYLAIDETDRQCLKDDLIFCIFKITVVVSLTFEKYLLISLHCYGKASNFMSILTFNGFIEQALNSFIFIIALQLKDLREET